jgi:hypothetical protein
VAGIVGQLQRFDVPNGTALGAVMTRQHIGEGESGGLCFEGSAKVVEAMIFPSCYRQVTEKERDHDLETG